MKCSLLINMKLPTIVGIFIFISRENFISAIFSKKEFAIVSNLRFISMTNFMLSWVEHEKSFTSSGPDVYQDIYIYICFLLLFFSDSHHRCKHTLWLRIRCAWLGCARLTNIHYRYFAKKSERYQNFGLKIGLSRTVAEKWEVISLHSC